MSNRDDAIQGFAQHGARLTGRSDEVRGPCPFCKGRSRAPFCANAKTRVWKCMKCGEGGDWGGFLDRMAERYKKALRNPALAELSKNRGIPPAALRRFGVGWRAASQVWTIPWRAGGKVSTITFWDPAAETLGTKGGTAGVFSAGPITSDTVWVCEGPWDAMVLDHVLRTVGEKADVVSTWSATSFHDDLADALVDRHVVLAYDCDDPGRTGLAKARAILEPRCASVRHVAWPAGTPDKHDVRDEWLKSGQRPHRTAKALTDYLTRSAASPEIVVAPGRAGPVPLNAEPSPPGEGMNYDDMVTGYRKWLYLPDPTILDVIFGTCLANRLGKTPVWMFIVGPSSCGKTDPLASLFGAPLISVADTMTPASLVSGSPGKNENDPSEIPRWKDRVVVMKDFTTILSLPHMQRDQVFGYLRGAFDGRIDRTFGTGVRRHYRVKFGLIAGVTPEIEKFTQSQSALGPRFLRYRVRSTLAIGAGANLIDRALDTVDGGQESQKDEELRVIARAVLARKVTPEDRPRVGADLKIMFRRLAQWTAMMRGGVARDKYTRELDYLPQAEIGGRIGVQLLKLAIGIAILHRHEHVGLHEFRIATRVARDCVPDMMERVVRQMWLRRADHDLSSQQEMEKWCRLPAETLRRVLDNGYMLKIFRRERPGGTSPYHWCLARSVAQHMELLDLFSGEE